MFVGREFELNELECIYNSNKFEFLVLSGRKHIGKTMLLTHFMKKKNVLFYSAQESSNKLNLEVFSNKIFSFFSLSSFTPKFLNWRQLFAFLSEQANNSDFTLIIDEFPYLANADKSILSILQHEIDITGKILI